MLENVYGYKEIKKELELIYSWYMDKAISRVRIPKGILLYGPSGVGKTLIMREYSKVFNYKIFELKGDSENLLSEISLTYELARKEGKAIVIIDEFDKLVLQDNDVARILQASLDGFNLNSDDNSVVLTLATANYIDDIPEPLLRQGRFDRLIKIDGINKNDMDEIIRGFICQFNISMSEDDIYELVDALQFKSPCIIKSCFMDAYNRYGFKLNAQNILDSLDYLCDGIFIDKEDIAITKHIAIHEAGHALFIYKYCKHFKFMRVLFDKDGGKTIYIPSGEVSTISSRMELICGGLAGLMAEEVVFGYHEVGCADDLEVINDLAYRLANRSCIYGINNFACINLQANPDKLSNYRRLLFENRKVRLIKKEYRYMKHLFKKEKDLIKKLGDEIYQNHQISRNRLIEIVN